ncbi:MAG: hypothetical protein GY797_11710 [Deltaproteobacteria bacterium]|nr:hypothetical protein [Deltaproteobacteria bacterium]
MMKKIGVVLVIGIIFIFLCGLFLKPRKFTLKEIRNLGNITRIELHVLEQNEESIGYRTHHIRTITNKDEISSIVEKAKLYSENWQHDEFSESTRLGLVIIEFYSDEKLKAEFGISYTDKGQFFLQKFFGPGRYIQKREFEDLMRLLRVEENFAHFTDR